MKINGILQSANFIKVNGETVIELGVKQANSTNDMDFFIVQKDFVNKIFLDEEINFEYAVLQSGQNQSAEPEVKIDEISKVQLGKIDFEALYSGKTIEAQNLSFESEVKSKLTEEPTKIVEPEVSVPATENVEKNESRESVSKAISDVSSEKTQKKKPVKSGIAGLLEAASLFGDEDEEEGEDDDD
ncbi:hypothetical protein RyT2_05740 [Pseudolactococcus yaeyamensis]